MADTQLATIGHDMFSDTRLQLIRNTVARDAPPEIFAAMIEIARVRNLDPLAKQISVIHLGGSWQVLTTIDGYRALAEQSNAYAGQDEPIHVFDDNNRLVSSTVTVYKIVQGMRVPFTAKVYASEYNTGRSSWLKMPITMLSKVAESHALRKAFPSILSGLYTREEMDQAEAPRTVDTYTGEIIDAPTRPAPVAHTQIDGQALRASIVSESKAAEEARNESGDHEKAMKAIFAAGGERGLKEGDIKAIAYDKYKVDSMTKLTLTNKRDYWKYLNNTDPDVLKDLASDLVMMALEADVEDR